MFYLNIGGMHKIITLPSDIKVFSGKDAKKLRRDLLLGYWEHNADTIVIVIPDDTYAFSGLFLKTLMQHGCNLVKYQWRATQTEHQAIIDQHLLRLRSRKDYNDPPTLVARLKKAIEYAIHTWEWRRKCHTN
jgi:hypothetical protein